VKAQPKAERTCPCGRTFIAGPHAKWGPCCRWKHRGRRPKKYVWTDERDQVLRERYDSKTPGAIAALAAAIGWPDWAIKKRAAQLGLTRPAERKEWTPEDVAFLWEHTGTRHSHWIAKKLGRSEASVVMKQKHMKLARRVRHGYTQNELKLCFGTDHHVIQRWIRQGKLNARRAGTDRAHDTYVVTDADVVRFITDHPMAFRLDKVDQFWFMDLITSGGLLRRAFADEQALDESAQTSAALGQVG
jgi:hypothetical protein